MILRAFVAVCALIALSGCIEGPPAEITSFADVGPISDASTRPDLGTIRDQGAGADDLGDEPDQNTDTPDLPLSDMGGDQGTLLASPIFDRIEALWTFETSNVEADIGDFRLDPPQPTVGSTSIQGSKYLELQFTRATSVSDQLLGAVQPDNPIVIGAWVRLRRDLTTSSILAKWDQAQGGWALMIEQGRWGCSAQRGSEPSSNVVSSLPATRDIWVHVACSFAVAENGSAEIEVFVNGERVTRDQGTLGNSRNVLRLGSLSGADYSFEGDLDEVFVADARAVDEAAIQRIYACGIDGARCVCSPTNSEKYVECDRLLSCDDVMTPCRF